MIQQTYRPAPEKERRNDACRHHWIIEAPTGPVSNGVCQVCGQVREFKNYIESAFSGEDTALANPTVRDAIAASDESPTELEEA